VRERTGRWCRRVYPMSAEEGLKSQLAQNPNTHTPILAAQAGLGQRETSHLHGEPPSFAITDDSPTLVLSRIPTNRPPIFRKSKQRGTPRCAGRRAKAVDRRARGQSHQREVARHRGLVFSVPLDERVRRRMKRERKLDEEC
jgi:hypothetical protein